MLCYMVFWHIGLAALPVYYVNDAVLAMMVLEVLTLLLADAAF